MTLENQLRATAQGDRQAFAALYRTWQPPLLRFATGLLAGDRSAAEDVVDEALVAVWQQAARYSGSGSAEGWLRRITRNKAIDWIRRTREAPIGEDALIHTIDDAATPAEAAELQSDHAALRTAMGLLSMEHREAIWLCYFEDRPLAEIAEIADCPIGTIKTRLFHARRILRETGLCGVEA